MSKSETAATEPASKSPRLDALKTRKANLEAKLKRIPSFSEDRRVAAEERTKLHLEQINAAIKKESK